MMEGVGVSVMDRPKYIDIDNTYILMVEDDFFILFAPSISEAHRMANDYCFERRLDGYVLRPLSTMVWAEINFAQA